MITGTVFCVLGYVLMFFSGNTVGFLERGQVHIREKVYWCLLFFVGLFETSKG